MKKHLFFRILLSLEGCLNLTPLSKGFCVSLPVRNLIVNTHQFTLKFVLLPLTTFERYTSQTIMIS